jgi:hypothetical protein
LEKIVRLHGSRAQFVKAQISGYSSSLLLSM